MQLPSPTFGVSGHITMTKIDAFGNVNFHSEFQNLVLDSFFKTSTELMGSNTEFLARHDTIFLGADVQTPPQVTDTALANQIAHRLFSAAAGSVFNQFVLGDTITEDYLVFRRIAQFSEEEALGNLTEVGLGHFSGGGQSLSFRSLIKNADGVPVVVTKSNDERLIVGYEFRIYRPPLYSVSEPFMIAGEPFRFVSTMLFSGANIDNRVPVSEWDFESMRGMTSTFAGDGFAGLAGSNTTFAYQSGSSILLSNLAGARDLVVAADTQDREVYPMVVIRGANNPSGGSAMNIRTTPNTGSLPDYGGSFCNRWVFSAHHVYPIIGVLVDATTLAPKSFILPANHRLRLTTNPLNTQIITRRT